jgi:hypothetical protein
VATREQVRAALEKVPDAYLDILYRMILSLEGSSNDEGDANDWSDFVAATYGSLTGAPIAPVERLRVEDRE